MTEIFEKEPTQVDFSSESISMPITDLIAINNEVNRLRKIIASCINTIATRDNTIKSLEEDLKFLNANNAVFEKILETVADYF